jgi:mono/diheme cytochrome c family protein
VTTRTTLIKILALCAFVLLAVVYATAARTKLGYSELSNGRGGADVEAVVVPDGFDQARSLAAFKDTVYPVLRAHCSGCHSSENRTGSGAQAPLHADVDVNLAHEYALTRVNFREPENSKLVVRMAIDRHHCFGDSCAAAAATMLTAVTAWRNRVAAMIPAVPPGVDQSTKISEAQIMAWIAADTAKTPAADREFIKYASFHVLHNAGVSPLDMNHARVGLSKALNTAARWAPRIVNPVDVNGKGILYKFDIRDYWGYTLIDTSDPNFELFYGGSDDDLSFAKSKVDLNGKPIKYAALAQQFHKLKPEVTRDDKFARLVWARILKGNAEAATGVQVLGAGNVIGSTESAPPNIDGFVGARKMGGNKQEYVDPEDFQYAEAAQLTYTLTRPDVYNAIMAIPGYMYKFEEELGVDKSRGMDSFDYMVTRRAITIDSRFMLRAQTKNGGFYWKTFDIFTQGSGDIDQAYQKGDVTNPFWSHPIPKFIENQGGTTPEDLSYVATLELGKYSFDPKGSVGRYTGKGGAQQSAEELIWSLPNGLQGYGLFGAWSQRRVDAFTKIVRDPRIQRYVADKTNSSFTGDGFGAAVADQRLINASSCIGCHTDGMNRANNDLRDWLDEGGGRLPKGEYGADAWLKDPETVARIRELYKPSSVMREKIENDRRVYLNAMAQIKQGMVLGIDKNVYVEPTIWTIEWAQQHYNYPITRSN